MAKKKSISKATAKKKTAKKATKKIAKKKVAKKKVTKKKAAVKRPKSAPKKKATKKATPKVRKAAKKTSKKAVRKTVKKTARKVVKKTTKKVARKRAAPAPIPTAANVPVKKLAKPKIPRRTKHTPPPPPLTVIARPEEEQTPAPPMSMLPQVGNAAPEFELRDQHGQLHHLSDYHGQWVVLYFYPRDNTPGCTTEACGFRNRLGDFTDRRAVVLGVSSDSSASHLGFIQKFGLNFTLLADEDHVVAEKYGVWVEKQRYGRTYMGIARTTFLINPDGNVARVFENVKPDGHEQEVLLALGQ